MTTPYIPPRPATVRGQEDPNGGGSAAIQPKLRLPSNVDSEQRKFLEDLAKRPPVRDRELLTIRDHFEGGPPAIGGKYFAKPPRMSQELWDQNRQLLTHVNLVRPSVRCWCSAVYSGEIVRRVANNPYQPVIEPWVASVDYAQAVYDWNENATVYGTSVAVPVFDQDTGEMSVWLPDPVYTHIVTDPRDVRRIAAVAEIMPQRIQFVTTWGEGVMARDYADFVPRDFGVLPVVVAYGIDRRHRGEVYGLSLVRDAVTWSIRATSVAYNVSLLQKQQTRSILLRIGDLERLSALQSGQPVAQATDGGSMDLPEGFSPSS